MPTTSESGGVRRKLDGLAAWVTHAGIWLGAISVLPQGVFYLMHPRTPLPWTWWNFGSGALFIATMILISWHENGAMCERCFAEVPADASVRAVQNGYDYRMLRFYHRINRVIIALVFVLPALVLLLDLYAVNIAWSVVDILMILSWRTHRLLRPWCPWCNRWDDGGSHEALPAPDPSMEKTV